MFENVWKHLVNKAVALVSLVLIFDTRCNIVNLILWYDVIIAMS